MDKRVGQHPRNALSNVLNIEQWQQQGGKGDEWVRGNVAKGGWYDERRITIENKKERPFAGESNIEYAKNELVQVMSKYLRLYYLYYNDEYYKI